MRIGILGGTFDPVHIGHVAAAIAAADSLDLDEVLLVPAGEPWHREQPHAPARDRLAMCALAAHADPRLAVSAVDVERPGPTYTIDTLRDLARQRPQVSWSVLLGADALASLATWRDPAGIGSLAQVVGLARPGETLTDPRVPGVKPMLVAIPPVPVSSTLVREAVAQGAPLEGLVPPAVADYIAEHGLYRAGS